MLEGDLTFAYEDEAVDEEEHFIWKIVTQDRQALFRAMKGEDAHEALQNIYLIVEGAIKDLETDDEGHDKIFEIKNKLDDLIEEYSLHLYRY